MSQSHRTHETSSNGVDRTSSANSAISNRVSAEDWLRGYFGIYEADVQGAAGSQGGKWKNIDYLRLRDVGLHLLGPGPESVILDIGCANGPTMIYCGLQGAKVYGVDLDPTAVADANRMLTKYKVVGEASVGDATSLPFPADHFDGVISSDFVEHITDDVKVKMLREARRVLKPGGTLVTKTPNLWYLRMSLFYKRVRAMARLENPLKYVIPHTPGTDDPQHIGLATRESLMRCLIDAGFLNYEFHYAPLRRFGASKTTEILSTEVPFIRDFLCEDLFCRAYKPIVLSHFPD